MTRLYTICMDTVCPDTIVQRRDRPFRRSRGGRGALRYMRKEGIQVEPRSFLTWWLREAWRTVELEIRGGVGLERIRACMI